MNANDSILCPSHRCKPGAMLLGVRQEDGTVAILPQPLPVDADFVARARQNALPAEQLFRFTNKCIEGGCKQWNGKGCGVVERVVQFMDAIPADASQTLIACGIRSRCRWYIERGAMACKICPYVLTELTEEEVLNAQETSHEMSFS